MYDIAVYLLDATLVAVLLYLVWLEYKANHVAALFWATILGIYALPAFGDPSDPAAPVTGITRTVYLAGNAVLILAPLFALLFATFYIIVRRLTLTRTGPLPVDIRADIVALDANDRITKRFLLLLTIAAIVGSLSGVYAIYSVSGSEGIFESGYSSFRLNADPTFVRPAIYLLAAGSGGVFLAWRTRSWTSLTLIVAAIVGYFFLSFARQMLLFMAAPFALHLMYAKRSLSSRVSLVLGAIAGYYFIIFLCLLRYRGSNTAALEALFSGDLFQDVRANMSQEGGEAQIRYVYYYFVSYPDASASVTPAQTYFRLLMLPIPSEWSLGLKPDLVDQNLWYAFYTARGYRDTEGGSLHALIFGDSFVNLGWFGALLGGFWASAAHLSNVLLAKVPRVVRLAIYAPLGFGVVCVARGAVYNACAYVFWCSIIIYAIYGIARLTVGLESASSMATDADEGAKGST